MLKPEISVSYSCHWVLNFIISLPMPLIPEVPKFITFVFDSLWTCCLLYVQSVGVTVSEARCIQRKASHLLNEVMKLPARMRWRSAVSAGHRASHGVVTSLWRHVSIVRPYLWTSSFCLRGYVCEGMGFNLNEGIITVPTDNLQAVSVLCSYQMSSCAG